MLSGTGSPEITYAENMQSIFKIFIYLYISKPIKKRKSMTKKTPRKN